MHHSGLVGGHLEALEPELGEERVHLALVRGDPLATELVRLAAYLDVQQATADAVAADLKAKGFKSFVVPHKDGKTTLYRVRVGPVASRAAADALAKKITDKTGQAARPVPHP